MIRVFSRVYDRLAVLLLLGQYAFVNLAFDPTTQNITLIKDVAAPFLSIVILGVWICGDLASRGRWIIPRHPILPAITAGLVAWIVALLGAPVPTAGLREWIAMAGYFVTAVALIRFIDTPYRMRTAVNAVVAVNVVITLYALTQYLGEDFLVTIGIIPDWGRDYVFVGTHGNQNFLAGYLIATLPILIGYWLVSREIVILIGLPFLIALNLYEIALAEARGAYIGAAATLLAAALIFGANRKNLRVGAERRRVVVGAAACIILFIGFAVVGFGEPQVLQSAAARIERNILDLSKGLEGHWTNRARLVFWQTAIDGGRKAPVFGRGLGNFPLVNPEFRPIDYHRNGVSHNVEHAHNEYLEWFTDAGLFGLSVFLLILATYLRCNAADLGSRRTDVHFPLLLGILLGPWAIWIQSLFDVETRWTGTAVTLWWGVGLALAFRNFGISESASLTSSDPAASSNLPNAARGPRATSRTALVTASNTPFLKPAAIFFALTALLFANQGRLTLKSDRGLHRNIAFTDFQQGSARDGLAAALESLRAVPTNVSTLYKLGFTYIEMKDYERAIRVYRALQTMAPNYAQIHGNIAELSEWLGFRHASVWERERASWTEYNGLNHRDAAAHWMQHGYPIRAIAHQRHAVSIERDRKPASGYFWWLLHDEMRVELARFHATAGDRAQADREIDEALMIDPEETAAVLFRFESLRGQGRAEEAGEILAGLLARAPNHPQALLLDARTAFEGGDLERTIDRLERLIFALPIGARGAPSPEAQAIAGSAFPMLERISRVPEFTGRAFHIAGWMYAALGDSENAEAALGRAYGLLGQDSRVAERLGMVRARK